MVIDTKRLRIRKFTLEDTDFIIRILNDPDFIRHVVDRGIRTTQEAENYLQEVPLKSYRENGFGFYVVALKTGEEEPETLIGMCGLIKRDFLQSPDIGYAFLPEFRGKGYAREAASAILELARNHFRISRVEAITSKDNFVSRTLLTDLGMTLSGTVIYPESSEELLLFTKEL
ncbi:GNAT family N-acetyltransferase [Hahella ganghwensis]|uniref:GNAT family N-acetyltransferase n=1 Tax=Hahella ganghwensis TaxID=286420 RepID=UPI00036DC7BB|nr:GNAT family N-acetyltransferase [Hahella ganghwensis]